MRTGLLLTDEDERVIRDVISAVYMRPIRTASNYAKEKHLEIALAASLGLITIQVAEQYGRFWRVTGYGLTYLTQGYNDGPT